MFDQNLTISLENIPSSITKISLIVKGTIEKRNIFKNYTNRVDNQLTNFTVKIDQATMNLIQSKGR